MPLLIEQERPTTAGWQTAISNVLQRLPPLWDLSSYIAVNPFLGFSDRHIAQATTELATSLDAQLLPPISYYRSRWKQDAFALPDSTLQILNQTTPLPTSTHSAITTFSEQTPFHNTIIRSIARWCAVYATRETSSWQLPPNQSLYQSWRRAEQLDLTLEISGLPNWRKYVAQLPESPDQAIDQLLTHLSFSNHQLEPYLYRLLAGLYGWASFFRQSSPDSLRDLLAIRLASDIAAMPHASAAAHRTITIESEELRLSLQEALEDNYTTELFACLPSAFTTASKRPAIQAAFCIDVRSEPFRRHLESQSQHLQTIGFAGFFGVPLAWNSTAQCPVLLKPAIFMEDSSQSPKPSGILKHLQSAPPSLFSFVETLGALYCLAMAKEATLRTQPATDPSHTASVSPTLTPDALIQLATGILRNMSLNPQSLARLVLFCGHEGQTANNPHAASLHCGACAGHSGAINARVAAKLFNNSVVRATLQIPADTHFLAAVHNTTTDQVHILDAEAIPRTHHQDLLNLTNCLETASHLTRLERSPGATLSTARKRATDISEVRPEWGLARNAAFIAARRIRTRSLNLQGRAFLHDYDHAQDPDHKVLTNILTAPMIVASWINLQYFASTVDNHTFGCGNKPLHNRVGTIGVVLGNGGDLKTGLAIQSVHSPDGTWFHEPLRLQVIVEAPCSSIDAVIKSQSDVRNLVENGWLRLFALSPDSNQISKRIGSSWVSAWVPNLDLQH